MPTGSIVVLLCNIPHRPRQISFFKLPSSVKTTYEWQKSKQQNRRRLKIESKTYEENPLSDVNRVATYRYGPIVTSSLVGASSEGFLLPRIQMPIRR